MCTLIIHNLQEMCTADYIDLLSYAICSENRTVYIHISNFQSRCLKSINLSIRILSENYLRKRPCPEEKDWLNKTFLTVRFNLYKRA